jgi:hypothetical protein
MAIGYETGLSSYQVAIQSPWKQSFYLDPNFHSSLPISSFWAATKGSPNGAAILSI